ncbi:hypothetical protein BKA70DRAFT_1560263 [Coprinopsis sp. MPI-PUGE-AT-0042]|nr:hypothetical protein BKA70DRAFT_1560263 [Coprinopsis sp. MPI-PUGE-AT-0042]
MSLPMDLLCATAEQLVHDTNTLKALALTCKGLSDYCQRRIFSTIAANIVIGEGSWRRGAFGHINLDALLAVINDNERLGSYIKHLFFSLDCNNHIFFSPHAQIVWFNRYLPKFCQTYICPLLRNLTELKILRLHSILRLKRDTDLSQTIDIFQAISSPSLSHISIRNLPLALPKAPTHLLKLELWNSPLRNPENAEHCPDLIHLESFGYLLEDSSNRSIFTESSHTLKAIKDGKTLDLTRLRSFQFASHLNQDHYEAAEILAEAAAQLEEFIYVFPTYASGGGEHSSIPMNLLHPERRNLFERAKALRNVTFRISAEDINDDLAYRGSEWPRIFTWAIQSFPVFSGCSQLEEIRFQILDASRSLFASLSDDWRRLNALLISGTDLPASLIRVSISIAMTRHETQLEEGEISRLRKERGDLAKEFFKETHEKTGIVVNVSS